VGTEMFGKVPESGLSIENKQTWRGSPEKDWVTKISFLRAIKKKSGHTVVQFIY